MEPLNIASQNLHHNESSKNNEENNRDHSLKEQQSQVFNRITSDGKKLNRPRLDQTREEASKSNQMAKSQLASGSKKQFNKWLFGAIGGSTAVGGGFAWWTMFS